MSWVIKDTYSKDYYAGSVTADGWYHPDINRARTYLTHKTAYITLTEGSHHVIWPGNRILEIVQIKIEEIP